MKKNFILGLSLFAFVACNYQEGSQQPLPEGMQEEATVHYDLDNPDIVYDLPANLNEISGISIYQESKIACIQDEHAIIYIFCTQEEKISSIIDFGKSGDYEDLAVLGENAYVLRSDGAIIMINNFEDNQRKVIEIETQLKARNDTEGLVYDINTNSLLIACKETPSLITKNHYEGFKAIYRFDLKNDRLIEEPEYLLDLSSIDKVKNTGAVEKFFIQTARKLNLTSSDSNFSPSGIAIHPFNNNDIYIISSVGKLLIIMDKKGLINNIIELDQGLFNQPEGICFSNNGDLFISNEGGCGVANILKYSYL